MGVLGMGEMECKESTKIEAIFLHLLRNFIVLF